MAHYYNRKGEKAYTLIGANGKERNTNIKDARKLNLVPSVSTIIAQIDKEFLNRWDKGQLLNMVAKHKHLILKKDNWKEQLIAITAEETGKYSRRGNEIHNEFEKVFTDEIYKDPEFIDPVKEYLMGFGPDAKYLSEVSFTNQEGYGGRVDLIIETPAGLWIVDYKTKSIDSPGKNQIYIDYGMQLSAYANHYENVIGVMNILISVTRPGSFYVHQWSKEDLKIKYEMFQCLLRYWQLKNNYNSSFDLTNQEI